MEKVGVVIIMLFFIIIFVFIIIGNINKFYFYYIGYLFCIFYKIYLKVFIDYDDLMIFNKK